MNRARRSWGSVVATTLAIAMLAVILTTMGGLAAGYRPVVITTGSMGDAAPTGSLIIAAPTGADDIAVGDVLVMRRPGTAPITHRVIEILDDGDGLQVRTKGDANPDADPTAYRLSDEELVARWTAPGLGSALQSLRDPRLLLAIVAVLLVAATLITLRVIWSGDDDHDRDRDDDEHDDRPAALPVAAPLPAPATAPRTLAPPSPAPAVPSPPITAPLAPSPLGDARSRHRDPHGSGLDAGAAHRNGPTARTGAGNPAPNQPVRTATLGHPAALQPPGAP